MERLLSREEAAEALGVTTKWLNTLVQAGALGSVKLGRRRLFEPAALRRFIAEHRQGGPSAA